MERVTSNELWSLKQDLKQKGSNRLQDEELMSAMREQVTTANVSDSVMLHLTDTSLTITN